MPELTLIEGGGEGAEVQVCGICGIPHFTECGLLRRHLRHLELLGRSKLTVYSRQRTIRRLADYFRQAETNPVAEATAADLYEWRASLRLADGTVACYLSELKCFYAW